MPCDRKYSKLLPLKISDSFESFQHIFLAIFLNSHDFHLCSFPPKLSSEIQKAFHKHSQSFYLSKCCYAIPVQSLFFSHFYDYFFILFFSSCYRFFNTARLESQKHNKKKNVFSVLAVASCSCFLSTIPFSFSSISRRMRKRRTRRYLKTLLDFSSPCFPLPSTRACV